MKIQCPCSEQVYILLYLLFLIDATGSGKTLSYLIPIVASLLPPSLNTRNARDRYLKSGISAVVIAPTRELAKQIHIAAEELLRGTAIATRLLTSGTENRVRTDYLRRCGQSAFNAILAKFVYL